ncbi:IclR family transcriptional regulator [Leptothrix discophora]|uniref:IclR family transcriptional regulator n=1 Tax=Leptothrix discophora TaxID=89 RepID=A0ABT9FYT6_LEPDI|nr:IclR family transcriptional regulator [Leptothrix discophora]MDP4299192.1 IclR family transcriptional regulator [Leptothrix discophora]
MSGVMQRTLAILERLATEVQGVPLATLADELDIPRSAAHRLLMELGELGWVRQSRERGDYMLTTKLVSMGLNYLKASGAIDLCQPILDRLAEASGELVRLGVVDVDHITWVSLSQGTRSGLRYDPDQGIDVKLSCTASGIAWLSTLPEDDAIALVSRQGLGLPPAYGPNAPSSMQAVLKLVRQVRKQGYAVTCETYAPGLNAMSTALVPSGKGAVGVLAMSGPAVRLTEAKMQQWAPELLAAASDLAGISAASPLFNRAYAPAQPSPVAIDAEPAARATARPAAATRAASRSR